MAMRQRGPRVQLTVRMPVDEYREVATRARARGWSMSDYVGWCVARQIDPNFANRAKKNPLGFQPHPATGDRTKMGQAAPYVVVREFDDDE